MGNSTLPTVSDKLNIMASIHNRKLIAALFRELKEKDSQIQELRQNIVSLEDKLEELAVKTKREL
jgi:flagellar biosynthesis regulator FlaF